MESLEARAALYEELMQHEKTDWKKVFVRDTSCTQDLLNERMEELVDVKLTADPVIELIEKGVTDVKHLINKARGELGSDGLQGKVGRSYKPILTGEDVVDLESRDNKELV